MRLFSNGFISVTLAWLGLILAPVALHAQSGEVILLNLTNAWRYNQTVSYDGTNWTAPNFNDAALPSGRGVLGVETTSAFVHIK